MHSRGLDHWLPDLCRAESLLWILLLTVLLSITLELLISGLSFSLLNLGLRSLVILWIVLISCAAVCLMRRVSIDWPVALTSSAALVGFQLASLVGAFGQTKALGGSFIDIAIPGQLLSLLVGSAALRFFYVRRQERRQAHLVQQARYDLLQARIQPHFLFNTLNSIASLIASRPADAEAAVLNLADLMRSTLAGAGRPVALADELDICEKYLQIEKLRMGDRLRWCFEVPPQFLPQSLPALTLQPLLENAVLHGVARLTEGGEIKLTASEDNGGLRLTITNPVPAAVDSGRRGNELALDNVRDRLAMASAGTARLVAGRTDDLYRVDIWLATP